MNEKPLSWSIQEHCLRRINEGDETGIIRWVQCFGEEKKINVAYYGTLSSNQSESVIWVTDQSESRLFHSRQGHSDRPVREFIVHCAPDENDRLSEPRLAVFYYQSVPRIILLVSSLIYNL